MIIKIDKQVTSSLENECFEYGEVGYRVVGGFLSSSVMTLSNNVDYYEEICVYGILYNGDTFDYRAYLKEDSENN